MWRLTCLICSLGACITPDYGAAPFLCDKTGRCPEGYSCVEGVCRRGSPDLSSNDLPQADVLAGDQALDAGPGDMPATDRGLDAAPDIEDTPDLLQPDAYVPPGTWKALNKGTFKMGSPSSEPCRENDEDQHQVTLTRGFWILSTEVTQNMFNAILGYLPAGLSSCGSCPVALISWHEAAAYCNALSQNAGLAPCYSCSGSKASVSCTPAYSGAAIYTCPGYRLPTEAEWEHACRAGTTTALYNGPLPATECEYFSSHVDPIAWFSDNSGTAVHEVGKKQANNWGLFDMSGNVFEWCHDRYQASLGTGSVTDPVKMSGTDACTRGGSYGSWPRYVRSANRGSSAPGSPVQTTGFRCVRTRP